MRTFLNVSENLKMKKQAVKMSYGQLSCYFNKHFPFQLIKLYCMFLFMFSFDHKLCVIL